MPYGHKSFNQNIKWICRIDYNPNGRNASNLWKGISSVWMALRDCVRWEIGNGNMVRFWMDEWLPNGVKLMEIANAGTSSKSETLK